MDDSIPTLLHLLAQRLDAEAGGLWRRRVGAFLIVVNRGAEAAREGRHLVLPGSTLIWCRGVLAGLVTAARCELDCDEDELRVALRQAISCAIDGEGGTSPGAGRALRLPRQNAEPTFTDGHGRPVSLRKVLSRKRVA